MLFRSCAKLCPLVHETLRVRSNRSIGRRALIFLEAISRNLIVTLSPSRHGFPVLQPFTSADQPLSLLIMQ